MPRLGRRPHLAQEDTGLGGGRALALNAIDVCQPTRVKVDVIGIGYGMVGRLKELGEESVDG
jgi:hypothetical protein